MFLIAITTLMLFGLDSQLRRDAYRLVAYSIESEAYSKHGGTHRDGAWLLVIGGPFLVGLGLSLYHAFSKRRKGLFTKHLMLYFAMMASGLAGIAVGWHMLKEGVGVAIVFAVWNTANGGLLLYQLGLTEPSMIDDTDATLRQMAVTVPVVLALLLTCRFVFSCHWSTTFAVGVGYSVGISEMIVNLPPFRHNPRMQTDAAVKGDGGDEGR